MVKTSVYDDLEMIVKADGSGTWLFAHISNPDTIEIQLVDKEIEL